MKAVSLLRGALALLLAAAIVAAAVYSGRLDSLALQDVLARSGAAGALIFIVIYTAAALLFLPGSVLTTAAGALFGPVAGTFYSLTGATLGATLAFFCARYMAGDWVRQRAAGRLKTLLQGVEAEGWRFVVFARLVPLFPFNGLNYALGLTRIPLVQFVGRCLLYRHAARSSGVRLSRLRRAGSAGGKRFLDSKGAHRPGAPGGGTVPSTLRAAPAPPQDQRHGGLRRRANTQAAARRRRAAGRLDVRSPSEYQGELGHIPGAINIPLAELSGALPRLEALKDREIVVVCRTDKRSAKAAGLLRDEGFRRVEVLLGGIKQWNRQGFPVARQIDSNSTENLHDQGTHHP